MEKERFAMEQQRHSAATGLECKVSACQPKELQPETGPKGWDEKVVGNAKVGIWSGRSATGGATDTFEASRKGSKVHRKAKHQLVIRLASPSDWYDVSQRSVLTVINQHVVTAVLNSDFCRSM